MRTCHEPERSTSSRRTREQWLQTVNGMVARGVEGTDAELMGVVEYPDARGTAVST